MGQKLQRILPKVTTSTSLLDSFTCCKFTTWEQRLYFPTFSGLPTYFSTLKPETPLNKILKYKFHRSETILLLQYKFQPVNSDYCNNHLKHIYAIMAKIVLS